MGRIFTNRYDIGIILLISLLIFGGIGGMLSPIRVVALILSPYIWINIIYSKSKEIKIVLAFFILWYTYSLFSLCWTSSISEALKELFYYYCHFSLFFLIILWSKKAQRPLLSVILGWCLFFVYSLPIALNEIWNNFHLSSSLHGNLDVNIGHGIIVNKKYAAVTFGNYNTYVTILCYSLPFLFSLLLYGKKLLTQFIGWSLVLSLAYILITNASRGGIISYIIVFIIFLFHYKNVRYKHKRLLVYFIVIILLLAIVSYGKELFMQILLRIGESDNISDVGEDSSRITLIKLSLKLFAESMFIGTGIGSIVASLQTIAPEFTIPHNLFIEILVQYSFIIFFFFLFFLYKLYLRARHSGNNIIKFVIYSSLACLPFVGVINSGYLLAPEFWVYGASLFIFYTK